MSKLEKLIQKLLRDPPELSYDDVYYILTQFNFQEISNKGSHHTFRNESSLKITIPKKGGQTVKRTYLKQIVKLLELDK
ncbi:type II toxin-antitoxin system HicA family toxin [Pseudanabaena sp. UWO311]|uniref:type II toxin-antitoxin system HicA family toxin n=1 Tax=Pseudanabaena sp. UWO311 TaxID=2487337 RepID=UPI0011594BE3|nr:type II toxin-antitoxin system HicA family toxin [Pseudanabaena sp. UWO311]TYQ29371.1 type II toxin-antitoxin system HicA family toxin [Pseudanabaena sp. UWO311]